MAITDAYATAAEYLAAIDKSDTSENTEIEHDLNAISRWLDLKLGRFFSRDSSAVARVYRPSDPWPSLYIDDAVSVSSVKIDKDHDGVFEVTLASSEYELHPLNAAKQPEPHPYDEIRMTPAAPYGCFEPDEAVEVTGVFGWPAIPKAIKLATIHLTAILRLETPRATATVNDLGQLVQMSPQARRIVDDLARQYGRLVVA